MQQQQQQKNKCECPKAREFLQCEENRKEKRNAAKVKETKKEKKKKTSLSHESPDVSSTDLSTASVASEYLSQHRERHVCSLEDKDEEGFVTHLAKHLSRTVCWFHGRERGERKGLEREKEEEEVERERRKKSSRHEFKNKKPNNLAFSSFFSL